MSEPDTSLHSSQPSEAVIEHVASLLTGRRIESVSTSDASSDGIVSEMNSNVSSIAHARRMDDEGVSNRLVSHIAAGQEHVEPFKQGTLLVILLLEKLCRARTHDQERGQRMFRSLCRRFMQMNVISYFPLETEQGQESLNYYRRAFDQLLRDELRASALTEGDRPPTSLVDDLVSAAAENALVPHVAALSPFPPTADLPPVRLESLFRPSRFRTEFREIRSLGTGGFGSVVEAKHVLDDGCYAVKKVQLRGTSNCKKVLREVTALAKLEHPAVVRYFAAWLESDVRAGPCGPNCWRLLAYRSGTSSETTTRSTRRSSTASVSKQPNSRSKLNGGTRAGIDPDRVTDGQKHSRSGDSNSSRHASKSRRRHRPSHSRKPRVRTVSDSQPDSELEDSDSTTSTSAVSSTSQSSSSSSPASEDEAQPESDEDDSIDIIFSEASSHASRSQLSREASFSRSAVGFGGTWNYSSFGMGIVPFKEPGAFTGTDNVDQVSASLSDQDASDSSSESPCQCGRQQYTLYIQMQLCERSLHDWLRVRNYERPRGVAPVVDHRVSLDIFRQVLEGVCYIHEQGLLHRDLKPKNIFMLSKQGRDHVKIGDFGLARELLDSEAADNDGASDMSGGTPHRHGSSSPDDPKASSSPNQPNEYTLRLHRGPFLSSGVGTETYASPEQLSGTSYDHRADVYSLGIILMELLCVFETEMQRGMAIRDLKQRQTVPDSLLRSWPREAAVILCMTSSKPQFRPSCREILCGETSIFDWDDDQTQHLTPSRLASSADREAMLQRLKQQDEEIRALREEVARLRLRTMSAAGGHRAASST